MNTLREFFTDESKWTKDTSSRDVNGEVVMYYDDKAVCWCLTGGINKIYPSSEKMNIIKRIVIHLGIDKETASDWWRMNRIIDWNDDPSRTFTEVRSLIEELQL